MTTDRRTFLGALLAALFGRWLEGAIPLDLGTPPAGVVEFVVQGEYVSHHAITTEVGSSWAGWWEEDEWAGDGLMLGPARTMSPEETAASVADFWSRVYGPADE